MHALEELKRVLSFRRAGRQNELVVDFQLLQALVHTQAPQVRAE